MPLPSEGSDFAGGRPARQGAIRKRGGDWAWGGTGWPVGEGALALPEREKSVGGRQQGEADFWALGIPCSSVGHILPDSTPGTVRTAIFLLRDRTRETLPGGWPPCREKEWQRPGFCFQHFADLFRGRAEAVVSAEAHTARHAYWTRGAHTPVTLGRMQGI